MPETTTSFTGVQAGEPSQVQKDFISRFDAGVTAETAILDAIGTDGSQAPDSETPPPAAIQAPTPHRRSLRERLTPRRLATAAGIAFLAFNNMAVAVASTETTSTASDGAPLAQGLAGSTETASTAANNAKTQEDQAVAKAITALQAAEKAAGITVTPTSAIMPNTSTSSTAGNSSGGSTTSTASTAPKSKGLTPAQRVTKAEQAADIPTAVSIMNSTPATADSNAASIFAASHKPQPIHTAGAESSMKSKYQELGVLNARETVDFMFAGDQQVANYNYNLLHGDDSREAPAGVSSDHVAKYLEGYLTSENTQYSIQHPTGSWLDNGQHTGTDVFPAHSIVLDGSQAVLEITSPDHPTLYFLMTNNMQAINDLCFNNIMPAPTPVVETPPPAPVVVVTPPPATVPPSTPPAHHEHHNNVRHTHTHFKFHRKTVVIIEIPPRHHEVPPPVPHKTPPAPSKHDSNTGTSVGGDTGETGGTGVVSPSTSAGSGSAGQTPNANGDVPGEAPSPTQAPDQTPAPLPTSSGTTGGEQGPDTSGSQAPSNSTNTGTTSTGDSGAPSS